MFVTFRLSRPQKTDVEAGKEPFTEHCRFYRAYSYFHVSSLLLCLRGRFYESGVLVVGVFTVRAPTISVNTYGLPVLMRGTPLSSFRSSIPASISYAYRLGSGQTGGGRPECWIAKP